MVRGLIRLNSSSSSGHSLWWPKDPAATRGYHVYRSRDTKHNWQRITDYPVPGQYYQDASRLQTVHFIVPPEAWIDAGELGQKCIRLPDIPYSDIQAGRPVVANSCDDVQIQVSYSADDASQVVTYRPAQVSGRDQTVSCAVVDTLPYGGAVSNFPIINFAAAVSFKIIYKKLVNFVDLSINMARTFYTVVSVTDRGEEHSPDHIDADVVDTMQVDQLDYIMAEAVRRNAWLFDQCAEPARLMLRRVAGDLCHCTDSVDGLAKARTGCISCYEQSFVGGFYGPFDFGFIPPDSALVRSINEGGQKVDRRSKSYLGRDPVIQDGDLIIRRNGERLVISGVIYKMPRGVLVQQEFDCALINPGDVRYNIPLFTPERPIIYNPVYTHINGDGSEPVFQADTVHGREIENKKLSPGRTVVFGNIQAPGWTAKKRDGRDPELP